MSLYYSEDVIDISLNGNIIIMLYTLWLCIEIELH